MIRIDTTDVEALAEEVGALCAGGQVQKIVDRRFGGVTLAIRTPGATHYLELVAEPGRQAIYLTEQRPARAEVLSPFARELRRSLEGSRVCATRALPGERILALELGRGQKEVWTLLAELFGNRANLYLLSPERELRAACDGGRIRRGLEPGAPYSPPRPRPGGQQTQPSGLGLAALPADGSRSRVLAEAFVPDEVADWCTQRRASAGQALAQHRKKQLRRLAALKTDFVQTEQAELIQRRAEALVALGRPQERGHPSIAATDYRDPGCATIEVELDPRRTLGENADAAFRRARKLRRAAPLLQGRLESARKELARLEAFLEKLNTVQSPEALEALDHELAELLPTTRRQTKGNRQTHSPSTRQPYRRYESTAGREILVGRGARENDALSLRIARGSDLWFHAEGMSGSHVVLRLRKGEEPDPESLLDAATLAAHFSRARKSKEASVLQTRCADLRKPRGAKPGAVLAHHARSRWIRIEPERLARLLGSAKAPHGSS